MSSSPRIKIWLAITIAVMAIVVFQTLHLSERCDSSREKWPILLAHVVIQQVSQYEHLSKSKLIEPTVILESDLQLNVLRADYVLMKFSISKDAKYQLENALERARSVFNKYPTRLYWIRKDTIADLTLDEPILPRFYKADQAFERCMGGGSFTFPPFKK
jgi:hypothetical protein